MKNDQKLNDGTGQPVRCSAAVRCVNWAWEHATIILAVFVLATTPTDQSEWLRVFSGCCGWITIIIMSMHIKNLNLIVKHYEQAS